ncbi:MAG TPA: hypothetical protein DDW70_00215 [Rikenellaceae bacterium]|jgi:F-type H+-transporting ATPase subunit epsilon|nr:hypothetical protein [Rikenellaceae bacterium]
MTMNALIYLQVISTQKIIFQGNVSVARFPGKKSAFTIMKDHAPILSLLEKGFITYEGPFGKGKVPVASGFVQVRKNEVYACIEQ